MKNKRKKKKISYYRIKNSLYKHAKTKLKFITIYALSYEYFLFIFAIQKLF